MRQKYLKKKMSLNHDTCTNEHLQYDVPIKFFSEHEILL